METQVAATGAKGLADVQEKENARENVRKLCHEPPPSPLAARA